MFGAPMKEDNRSWIRQKLEEAFLTAVRSCLNEEKAVKKASAVRENTTKVQMQLLLEIGEINECPFSQDDEDDVWLIFKTALGITGTERAGAYGRFIFTEAAEKQFRQFLRNEGRRRIAQEALRRIAGKEVAKYFSEKVLLRLIGVFNVAFGAWFNRWVTRNVGKWAKIRVSTF